LHAYAQNTAELLRALVAMTGCAKWPITNDEERQAAAADERA
jgi:hypothetical protein